MENFAAKLGELTGNALTKDKSLKDYIKKTNVLEFVTKDVSKIAELSSSVYAEIEKIKEHVDSTIKTRKHVLEFLNVVTPSYSWDDDFEDAYKTTCEALEISITEEQFMFYFAEHVELRNKEQ